MSAQSCRNAIFSVLVALCAALPAAAASAQQSAFVVKETKGDYNSVLQDLKDAIINRGLVIDYTGHVHSMLVRTGKATGAKSPYTNANYMQFCSAKLTHDAVGADPRNLAICPYVVFAYERADQPGTIRVGYRRAPGVNTPASKKAMAAIYKLLDGIVADAMQ